MLLEWQKRKIVQKYPQEVRGKFKNSTPAVKCRPLQRNLWHRDGDIFYFYRTTMYQFLIRGGEKFNLFTGGCTHWSSGGVRNFISAHSDSNKHLTKILLLGSPPCNFLFLHWGYKNISSEGEIFYLFIPHCKYFSSEGGGGDPVCDTTWWQFPLCTYRHNQNFSPPTEDMLSSYSGGCTNEKLFNGNASCQVCDA